MDIESLLLHLTDCRVGAQIRPALLAKFTDIKSDLSVFLLHSHSSLEGEHHRPSPACAFGAVIRMRLVNDAGGKSRARQDMVPRIMQDSSRQYIVAIGDQRQRSRIKILTQYTRSDP
jgi:hypothetical protein